MSTTATAAPAVLPGGQTVGADQVNIGTAATPNIINTSGPSRSTTAQNSAALNNALATVGISQPTSNNGQNNTGTGTGTGSTTTSVNPTNTTINTDGSTTQTATDDPYITSLNNLSASSNASTKNLINSIVNTKNTQSAATDKQYAAYKQGLQLLGIQHNEAQSTPDLLASNINQAEDQHQQKLQTIDANYSKALTDAQTAQDNNDFKTLNQQMAYIKQLNLEKTNELKAYQTTLLNQPKVATSVAQSVYSTMQTLDRLDQESFIQQVAAKYNLPLGSLVQALTDEHTKTQAAATKETSAEATAAAKGILSPSEAKTLGVPYGTTAAQAQKMGIVPTTAKSGKGSATAITKAQISAGEAYLDNTRGPDKFVDPFAYAKAYTDFTAKGGTTKAFITAFPPKDYVNPAATNLPSYLMPGKTKGSASSAKKS
jgi:hypothetical protein